MQDTLEFSEKSGWVLNKEYELSRVTPAILTCACFYEAPQGSPKGLTFIGSLCLLADTLCRLLRQSMKGKPVEAATRRELDESMQQGLTYGRTGELKEGY